jgi:hypothetical protein
MQKSILALASAAACVFMAGLAQAQTFPNYTPAPSNMITFFPGPTSSAAPNIGNDYIYLSHPSGGQMSTYAMLPLSAFAGSADLSATNANLAMTNNNLATTNANLLGLQNYAVGVRNLTLAVRKEARAAAASAIAISTASMPSAPGRTSWTVNAAEFNDQPGWGGSVAHRLNLSVPFAVTAGFAFSGANNGARVGLSGEF